MCFLFFSCSQQFPNDTVISPLNDFWNNFGRHGRPFCQGNAGIYLESQFIAGNTLASYLIANKWRFYFRLTPGCDSESSIFQKMIERMTRAPDQ